MIAIEAIEKAMVLSNSITMEASVMFEKIIAAGMPITRQDFSACDLLTEPERLLDNNRHLYSHTDGK